MDSETAIIIETYRRRRVLADEILVLLNDTLAEQPVQRTVTVRIAGKREVGLALFQATRKQAA